MKDGPVLKRAIRKPDMAGLAEGWIDLSGKLALVTGAASGIGMALVAREDLPRVPTLTSTHFSVVRQ